MLFYRSGCIKSAQRPMQRARHMRRRFAGGRGQRDARQLGALVAQQRQELGHGGGFAGAGAAADEHKRLQQRERRRIPLPFAARLCKPIVQILPRLQPIGRRQLSLRQPRDLGGQITLELPHAPQKQTPLQQHQRRVAATAHQRRRFGQSRCFCRAQPNKRMPVRQSGKQARHIRHGQWRGGGRIVLQKRAGRIGGGLV